MGMKTYVFLPKLYDCANTIHIWQKMTIFSAHKYLSLTINNNFNHYV